MLIAVINLLKNSVVENNGIGCKVKIFFSSIIIKLKNENNELVSFNGRSTTFHLPIKEI